MHSDTKNLNSLGILLRPLAEGSFIFYAFWFSVVRLMKVSPFLTDDLLDIGLEEGLLTFACKNSCQLAGLVNILLIFDVCLYELI